MYHSLQLIKNKHIKNTAIYFVSSALNKAIPFFLLPILTRYLTPKDYGIIGIITITMAFFIPIITLNPHAFILTKYHKIGKYEVASHYFNALCFSICIMLFFIIIYWLVVSKLGSLLGVPAWVFPFIFVISLSASVTLCFLTFLQLEYNTIIYMIVENSRSLLICLLIIYFVIFKGLDWEGRFFGDFFAIIIVGSVSLFLLIKNEWLRFSFSKKALRAYINFSLPLLPHFIALIVILHIGRYCISAMVSVEEAGIYTVAATVCLIVNMVLESISKAWNPFFYKKINQIDKDEDENAKILIIKITYCFYMFCIIFGILFILFIPYLIDFWIGEKFQASIKYVPWLTVAYIFFGMYRMVAGYFYHTNNTTKLALIASFSAVLCFGLNYFLIRLNGAIGAAQATCFSFMIYYGITQIAVLKLYPMPWLRFASPVSTAK